MAVRQITNNDTLQAGFRVKYNETVGEIITSASVSNAGILTLTKSNTGTIQIDLTGIFLTKNQIIEAIQNGDSVPAASEERAGKAFIATLEEALAGEDTPKIITPYLLQQVLSGLQSNQKTKLSLTPAQVQSTLGTIIISGVSLSCLDGVISIQYNDTLLFKHGLEPLVSCWFDRQSQPVTASFDNEENPTLLTINVGAIPSGNLKITII